MSVLEYRGYLGSVEVDVENKIIFGKLLYLRDSVTYNATSVDEIEALRSLGIACRFVTGYLYDPMLDGGAQLLYIIGIDTLAQIIRDTIAGKGEGLLGRAWHLPQAEPYTLRQVIEAIVRHEGRRRTGPPGGHGGGTPLTRDAKQSSP